MIDEGHLKIEGEELQSRWNKYLSFFKEKHTQVEDDPYAKGTNLKGQPAAYNEAISKTKENNSAGMRPNHKPSDYVPVTKRR